MQGPEHILQTGRVHPISLEIRPLQLENTQARDLGLRDGQIIQATLELRGNSLKLLVNGKLLDLPPGLRFRPGDTLWLKAQARSRGWLLRPLDARGAAAAEGAAPAADLPAAAGQHAAHPAPLPTVHLTPSRLQALLLRPPLSSELMDLLQPKEAATLLKTVGDAELVALFQRLQLSMRGLSPTAVQNSVFASGLWLEAMLGRGQPGAAPDLKTLLRRLIQALGERDSPDQARLARAIDDIESAQVESVKAQSRGELLFAMVIPFTDANPVELEFARAAGRRGQQQAPLMSVSLHTVHATLGQLWVQLTMVSATQVDLMLWALKAETADAARLQADALRRGLQEVRLSLGLFRVFNAARPNAAPASALPGAMLDVQT